ncbi:phosphonoacetaldehyde reductase [Photobacterium ganghwense]|uniref:phosphonoacetaldehyde reductase n=1 Tax=Photobacterium ganghwense TaxID=320778 RepID=UPI004057A472
MWQFHNPVNVIFGQGAITALTEQINGRSFALVTYDHPYFASLADGIRESHSGCRVVLTLVSENPDISDMATICAAFAPYAAEVEVLVALGGGSVIDATKALAVAKTEPNHIRAVLTQGEKIIGTPLPVIAVPTTTGTGSEVTSWATIWDTSAGRKYSLAHPHLYPEAAICDPQLTYQLPVSLTIQTGLDALSHALESLWNKHRNPLSTEYAKRAIRLILKVLPKLKCEPTDSLLREQMMTASLLAGLAFSNTKTSIAHNISYAITIETGLAHGIACSFTLPAIVRSFANDDSDIADSLRSLFGTDLTDAACELEDWLAELGVATEPQCYGYSEERWQILVSDALSGERGKNFAGNSTTLLQSF